MMTKTIFTYLCIAALALPVAGAFADDDSESAKPKTVKDHANKDKNKDAGKSKNKHKNKNKYKSDDDHDGHDQAASKGKKEGWVDGMPPGQAKKSGEGKVKHKDRDHEHGDADRDGHNHHDGHSGDVAESKPKPAPDAGKDGTQPPATSEEILTDIAKGEAARRAGAAPGSAAEALIHIGTDAAIERAKK